MPENVTNRATQIPAINSVLLTDRNDRVSNEKDAFVGERLAASRYRGVVRVRLLQEILQSHTRWRANELRHALRADPI